MVAMCNVQTCNSIYCPPSSGGYGVQLDHRHLQTPQRRVFAVPTEPLALAVAQEWNGQGSFVQPTLMHLVSLAK